MDSNAVGNVLAQLTGSEAYEIIGMAQGRLTEQEAIDRLQAMREAANPTLDTGIPPLCDR